MKNNKIAIKTFNLTKDFGKRRAVDNINLEINKGEIFSLLGKNGAGKTTTIKMLSCLLLPSSGYAEIMNYDTRKKPWEIRKLIGVSPQETAIAGHLNTMENLLLFGGLYGLKRDLSHKRALSLMELMELEKRKDQAQKLSGGMQRRLSIAMALMSDPEILFLDEPTLGLDPHSRRAVWNYISKLKGEKTILLTTHYLEEADNLADNIAVINNGEIIASGSPDELKRKQKPSQSIKISAGYIPENTIEYLKNQGLQVTVTSKSSSMVDLLISAGELDFYSIIGFLQDSNVFIKSIQMQLPTLEEVFVDLTGKEGPV